MKATHPDLYHHTRQAEMDAYVATFRRDAAGMNWPRYVMGVYRLIRLVGDGHTAMFPFPDAGPGFDTRLPILTEAFADGLYVIEADAPYRDAVGAKVVAVNGKPTADIVRTLAEYWPHENEMWVVRWLPAMLRRPGYLHGTGIATGDVAAPITFTLARKTARAATSPSNRSPQAKTKRIRRHRGRARDEPNDKADAAARHGYALRLPPLQGPQGALRRLSPIR